MTWLKLDIIIMFLEMLGFPAMPATLPRLCSVLVGTEGSTYVERERELGETLKKKEKEERKSGAGTG